MHGRPACWLHWPPRADQAAFDADALAADIGAAVLAAPAPVGVAPVALAPGGSAAEGDQLRLVGFGRSGVMAQDEGLVVVAIASRRRR